MPGKDLPDANQVDDLLRSLTNYTADMIASLEADGTIRYVNPVVERVLGYRTDELVGKNAFHYMHPDDEGRVSWAFVERQNNSVINPPLEFRVRHADRSWRHVEMMSNNLLHDPKVRGIVASVRDVSERKRAEEQVRFQAQLLEAVGQAIVATDLPGNVIYWGALVPRGSTAGRGGGGSPLEGDLGARKPAAQGGRDRGRDQGWEDLVRGVSGAAPGRYRLSGDSDLYARAQRAG